MEGSRQKQAREEIQRRKTQNRLVTLYPISHIYPVKDIDSVSSFSAHQWSRHLDRRVETGERSTSSATWAGPRGFSKLNETTEHLDRFHSSHHLQCITVPHQHVTPLHGQYQPRRDAWRSETIATGQISHEAFSANHRRTEYFFGQGA